MGNQHASGSLHLKDLDKKTKSKTAERHAQQNKICLPVNSDAVETTWPGSSIASFFNLEVRTTMGLKMGLIEVEDHYTVKLGNLEG